MSQITTHVLDTASGKPAKGIALRLEKPGQASSWDVLAAGKTDADGRVSDLLEDGQSLEPGLYRMTFETGPYFSGLGVATFYPEVSVIFETTDQNHYHVPLLISPFGYSTYRGS